MNKQKGAALVVVLSLLTVSLIVGMSSMQLSRIDERLAGNYKGKTQAQMGAEVAASEGYRFMVSSLEDADTDISFDDFFDKVVGKEFDWEAFQQFSFSDGIGKNNISLGDGGCVGNVKCEYRYLEMKEDNYYGTAAGFYVVAMGGVFEGATAGGEPYALGDPVFVRLLPSPDFPFLPDLKPITLLSKVGNFSVDGGDKVWVDSAGSDDASVVVSSDKAKLEAEMVNSNFNNPSVKVASHFDAVSDFKGLVEFVKAVSGYRDKIYYVDEDPDMKKYSEGMLVINDEFTWKGGSDFSGVILVVGKSVTYSGDESGRLVGSLVHAPIASLDADNWFDAFGDADIVLDNLRVSQFTYDKAVLESLDDILRNAPPAVISWE